MTVLRDINLIIEIDEVIVIHLPENREGYNNKNDINNQFLPVVDDIYFT